MNESISIGFSVAQRLLDQHVAAAKGALPEGDQSEAPQAEIASSSFFHDHFIHLHCPEGAVKKDGPSAGVTIVCALVPFSLLHFGRLCFLF